MALFRKEIWKFLYQDDTRSCGLGLDLGYCSCKCTRCNTLEYTATNSNTHVCVTCLCDVSVWRVCVTWQHTATRCNTLEYNATHCNTHVCVTCLFNQTRQTCLCDMATHCNTLQHTATHCNTHINLTRHVRRVCVTWHVFFQKTFPNTRMNK